MGGGAPAAAYAYSVADALAIVNAGVGIAVCFFTTLGVTQRASAQDIAHAYTVADADALCFCNTLRPPHTAHARGKELRVATRRGCSRVRRGRAALRPAPRRVLRAGHATYLLR